ncbi:hypothetical protein V1525DRAFT_393902 [Lipomyces kononenkoae]|uniref:Uncharacterized protein n=1 Tax=Lipomyces kononenkoae TaxID=34357 RepID=A0ACC3TA16_LIPKO
MSSVTPYSPQHVASIYRRLLRLSLNWTVRRDIWRKQALEIRAKFDANKNITDAREIRDLIIEGERQLAINRHPDPYIPPSRPGGSKFERNVPPRLDKPIDGDY